MAGTRCTAVRAAPSWQGATGDDTFSGRTGGDGFSPGKGRDFIRMGKGNDFAEVSTRDNDIDVFYCGPGNDRIDYLLKRVDPRDEFHGCETVTAKLPS